MIDCALDFGSTEGTPEDWRLEVMEMTAGTTRGTIVGRRRAAPLVSLWLAIERSIDAAKLVSSFPVTHRQQFSPNGTPLCNVGDRLVDFSSFAVASKVN